MTVKILKREVAPAAPTKSITAVGWGFVPNARKWFWHYFVNGKSMCGLYEMNEVQEYFDQSMHAHPSNCPECWRVMKEKGVVKNVT